MGDPAGARDRQKGVAAETLGVEGLVGRDWGSVFVRAFPAEAHGLGGNNPRYVFIALCLVMPGNHRIVEQFVPQWREWSMPET